ncbi:hypothetical protein DFJ73DRAFT_880794 [Zopfochytrium polystomum]|nr:hypothetical protein DFJ73DRAFT_880794 [Zopfochytrium polystomum]
MLALSEGFPQNAVDAADQLNRFDEQTRDKVERELKPCEAVNPGTRRILRKSAEWIHGRAEDGWAYAQYAFAEISCYENEPRRMRRTLWGCCIPLARGMQKTCWRLGSGLASRRGKGTRSRSASWRIWTAAGELWLVSREARKAATDGTTCITSFSMQGILGNIQLSVSFVRGESWPKRVKSDSSQTW